MTRSAHCLTSAIVAGLLLVSGATVATAQPSAPDRTENRVASLAAGVILGTVQDDAGPPVEGVVISAVGATTTVAVSDEKGRFEFDKLLPGPYLLRAHFTGFVSPRPQIIHVRPSVSATSRISLHRSSETETVPVLAAGLGGQVPGDVVVPPAPQEPASTQRPDAGETAWRLRHTR